MDNNELFHLARSIEDAGTDLMAAEFYQKPKLAEGMLVQSTRLINELVRREIERDGQPVEKS